jgi:hypothetical protein
MAFNKLRRQIADEFQAAYETPAEKIAAQSKLLTAALSALGGPVIDHRPQVETQESAVNVEATPMSTLERVVLLDGETGETSDNIPDEV